MLQAEMSLKNINDIRLAMSHIRKKGSMVFTNYYNQCSKCDEQLVCWQTEKAVSFQWIDVGIKRIFFYAVDEAELRLVIAEAPAGSAIDFITKEKNAFKELFLSAGYRLHLEYGRFHSEAKKADHKKIEAAEQMFDDKYGEMAVEDDAEEIDRLLREKFDPYEAHFYSMDKLREYIKKGWVWVAKENGKIVALQSFEIQGNKYYGSYVFNDGDVDVLLSLRKKIDIHLAKLKLRYSYGWMRMDNKRALRLTKIYASVFDGLYDMIYIKE